MVTKCYIEPDSITVIITYNTDTTYKYTARIRSYTVF